MGRADFLSVPRGFGRQSGLAMYYCALQCARHGALELAVGHRLGLVVSLSMV